MKLMEHVEDELCTSLDAGSLGLRYQLGMKISVYLIFSASYADTSKTVIGRWCFMCLDNAMRIPGRLLRGSLLEH